MDRYSRGCELGHHGKFIRLGWSAIRQELFPRVGFRRGLGGFNRVGCWGIDRCRVGFRRGLGGFNRVYWGIDRCRMVLCFGAQRSERTDRCPSSIRRRQKYCFEFECSRKVNRTSPRFCSCNDYFVMRSRGSIASYNACHVGFPLVTFDP
jgi:hypothetical protein